MIVDITVENQEMADRRVPMLLDIPAAHRFVSVEPMLGEVSLRSVAADPEGEKPGMNALAGGDEKQHIEWVIVGGESGQRSRVRPMDASWVQKLYDECIEEGVPFFFKQWGEWGRRSKEGRYGFEDAKRFPEEIAIRARKKL